MNLLDIIIAIPLLYFIYRGWKRGIIFEVAALCGIVAGAYAAIHFSNWVAQLLNLQGDSALLIAFLVTFVGVIALSFLIGRGATNIVKMVKAGFLNHLLGSVAGMLKALCVVSVLLSTLLMIDFHQKLITPTVKEESVFFKPTYKVGSKLTAQLKTLIDERRSQARECALNDN